jgi:hypothetical protein
MELIQESVKNKICGLVRRNLKGELTYYLEMAPYVPPLAAYYEAAAKEGLSREDRDILRTDTYRKALPELKACFDELMRDWESRMNQEKPDLSAGRINAVKAASLILFLTDI